MGPYLTGLLVAISGSINSPPYSFSIKTSSSKEMYRTSSEVSNELKLNGNTRDMELHRQNNSVFSLHGSFKCLIPNLFIRKVNTNYCASKIPNRTEQKELMTLERPTRSS